jgi:hypothetical protein
MIQTLLGYDWFIAYGHSDKGAPKSAGQSLARSLALELRKRGYRVCIDVEEYHPGQKLSLLTRLRVEQRGPPPVSPPRRSTQVSRRNI